MTNGISDRSRNAGSYRSLSRRRFLKSVVGAGAFAISVGPLAGRSTSASSSAQTLRVGVGATAALLDPYMSTQGAAQPVYFAIFDSLTYIDFPRGTRELKPALATEWKLIDPTVWEFKLRTGVVFANGEPFNADAVKFSIERALDPAKPTPIASRIPSVASVEVVNPLTVRFHTKTPDPLLPGRLSVVFMLPPRYFQSVGADGFNVRPFGTGAWMLDEFSPNNSISLRANSRSWRGSPKLRQIEIRVMPEDAARVSALQAGELDLIGGVPSEVTRSLEQRGMRIAQTYLGRVQEFFLRPAIKEFQSKEVRLALNYAIDRDSIVKNVMGGFARPMGQLIGPDGLGYNPSLKPYPYNPQKAKELLATAGYPSGFNVRFQGVEGLYVNDVQFQQAVMGYLSKIGVNLSYERVEFSQYFQVWNSGRSAPIIHVALNYFPVMDADFVYQWLLSTAGPKVYNSAQFDQLFDESRKTLDQAKRKDLLTKISQLLYDDPPAIVLFQPPDIYAITKQVTGFAPRPDLVMWFDTIGKS